MQKRLAYLGIASLFLLAANASCLAQSGADLYQSKCQMCHAPDGSGNTPAGKAMKARPFNSPDVMKQSDADLTAVIKKGKNKMPAFEGKLTDAQIASLIEHIHTLQK
ncbi:c-type cytochrome [Tunturiibacter gelidiferens]|uniref:c-type cytochrome n=1 Tax=Tunturiibacter gelidiferens TaxID=3069689 RepID=UPI003D9BABCC